jgi:hypothetical protein
MVYHSSCTQLVFNFHLQTGALSASTPTQPWVKTFRRKVAYLLIIDLMINNRIATLNNYKKRSLIKFKTAYF